ncbi:MAG: ATP synthase F1 subunit epsilon [Thermoleophilia bacterium]|nr:ATP synthase F1 subunit epsilon [Thermoleophilia bacterium]
MAGPTTFTVEVLTPEGDVFSGDVVQLSTRTVVGEIGILANHVPVMAALRPNLLRLKISESETREWAQAHGVLQVFASHAQLLVEEAHPVDQLDLGALEEQKSDAEARIADPETGKGSREAAERDLERIDVFLELARGA